MRITAKYLQLTLLLFCVNSASIRAYNVMGESWPVNNAVISAFIVGGSQSGTSWNQAFREAATLWTEASNFSFNVLGVYSHPCAGYLSFEFPEDGLKSGVAFHNEACGEPFGQGVLAITLIQLEGNSITETDIVFNQNVLWDVYTGPARLQVDFRRVAAHELGHVIGLSHESSAESLMKAFIDNIEAPTQDDLTGVAVLYGDSVAQILVNLEEPAANSSVSGVSNIRGWALATHGVDRVELYIDAALVANIPYGGSRRDVGNSFPEFLNSADSGFSMAFAWGLLEPGEHTVKVRAYDPMGGFEEQTSVFNVAAFANPFIGDPTRMQVGGNLQVVDSNSLRIVNMSADEQVYDVTLSWRTESQKFEIIAITPK